MNKEVSEEELFYGHINECRDQLNWAIHFYRTADTKEESLNALKDIEYYSNELIKAYTE